MFHVSPGVFVTALSSKHIVKLDFQLGNFIIHPTGTGRFQVVSLY